jgi:hypothetical protein
MAWGLGLEPRFSDPKSDVLPIRRPPNISRKMAWGPGLEPGFSDSESDILPIRRSPKIQEPHEVNAYWGSHPEGRPRPAFDYVKAGLHGLLLDGLHLNLR